MYTMNLLKCTVILPVLLYTITYCQDSYTENRSRSVEVSDTISYQEESDSTGIPAQRADNADETDVPANPFFTDDEPGTDAIADSGADAVSLSTDDAAPDQGDDYPGRKRIDILLDLSAGFGYSTLLHVTPEHYTIEGKGNFLFSCGVLVPFLRVLYSRISVSYFQVVYGTSFTTPDAIDMYVTRTGTERFNFLSAPIHLGCRFDLGRVLPFVYFHLEPAYLTSAGRYTETDIYATFSDTTYLESSTAEDADITMDRQRHQIFIGAGAGIELMYGYGSIYINGGFRYPLRNPGDANSKPVRIESTFINFPFSLGIRFYL